MIRISERFSFERDRYGWELSQYIEGKKKDGTPKVTVHKTYYPNLHQIACKIIDIEAGRCESMSELDVMLGSAEDALCARMKEAA